MSTYKAVMTLARVLEWQTHMLQPFFSPSTDSSVQHMPNASNNTLSACTRGFLAKINIPRGTKTATQSLTGSWLSLRPQGLQFAALLGIASVNGMWKMAPRLPRIRCYPRRCW